MDYKDDKVIESLTNNFDNFQNEFQKMIGDYKKNLKDLIKLSNKVINNNSKL